MTESLLPVLNIEHVDKAFIEHLAATAPPAVRVEHHRLAAFSASGPDWEIAAILIMMERLLGPTLDEIGKWIYEALRKYKADIGEDKAKDISINGRPANEIKGEDLRLIIQNSVIRERQRQNNDKQPGKG